MLDRNEVKRKIKAGEPPLTRDALERVVFRFPDLPEPPAAEKLGQDPVPDRPLPRSEAGGARGEELEHLFGLLQRPTGRQ